jgi:uncharacterized membrane protein YraQ (UPF0718 family)
MIYAISNDARRRIAKSLAAFSVLFFFADTIYKTVNDISYVNRQLCIINRVLPKIGFSLFENYVELSIMVFLGVFIAAILEKYFTRLKNLLPNNLISAFLYASLLPVCACSVIPMIKTLRGKLSFRNIIAFVVSAPLLSPYIIVLSLSVIGPTYTAIRIVSSFLLAASTGILMELLNKEGALEDSPITGAMFPMQANCANAGTCSPGIMDSPACKGCSSASAQTGCDASEKDIYLNTYAIFKEVFPFILVAGTMGFLLEYVPLKRLLLDYDIGSSLIGVIVVAAIGVPIYFCSGAEVLFLRPLMHTNNFSMGTAMAFSLSSTAICVTSAVMLIKFLGKRLTVFLVIYIFIFSVVLGYLLNLWF